MSTEPKFKHVFDITMPAPEPFKHKPTEHSGLIVANVTGGILRPADGGPELTVTGGSDWMNVRPDGAQIDARVSAEGPDGNLDLMYKGYISMGPEMQGLLAGAPGKEVGFGEGYYYTLPIISSRSEKYAWVNKSVFVAMGKLGLNADKSLQVSYKIFKIG